MKNNIRIIAFAWHISNVRTLCFIYFYVDSKIKTDSRGALPENLEDLVLRFALLSQRDVHGTLIDSTLQSVGHLPAHGLDLLMQESVLLLQLIVTALRLRHLLL